MIITSYHRIRASEEKLFQQVFILVVHNEMPAVLNGSHFGDFYRLWNRSLIVLLLSL